MKIYIVRHGQTEWNNEKRIQGQIDVPLNQIGIQQAINCSLYFSNIGIDQVYSSKLSRAIETARIITGDKMFIKTHDELNERNFGIWESHLWEEIHTQIPNLKEIWKNDDGSFKPQNGESLEDLVQRAQSFFKKIISENSLDSNILIVSHGGPIKSILGYVLGKDLVEVPDIAKQDNCCINIVSYDGNLNLEIVNYVHKNG